MRWLARTDRIFLAVVFIGLFGMAARNVSDPDLWWHLKTGQYIAENKSVPHTDPFSYTRSGQPWVAHEWLSELFLYELERTAGFGGLIVLFAAVLCTAFFFLYLRCEAGPYVSGVATLIAAWATRPVWGARPQVLTLLLASLWLLILERSERNPTLLWWTLPITLLWVNLHAGFLLGLFLSALSLAGGWIERRLGFSARSGYTKTAAFILLIDLLIVPLNPNGLRMFSYPIETLRSSAMQRYIAEWFSPSFHRAEYLPFLAIVLATFAVLSWCRSEVRPRDLLLLAVSLYAGLVSIRMMPLFVLIAVPLLARRIGEWPARQHSEPQPTGLRVFFNAAIALAMAIFVGAHIILVIRHQPESEMQFFPVRAATFLQAHPPSGAMFNHYDWGGYLIWRLYPQTRVFIDGRADVYGEKLFDQFADAYQFKGGWRQILQQWNIGTVVVPADSALATGLRNSPDWTVAYEDSQAVILNAVPHALQSQVPTTNPRRAVQHWHIQLPSVRKKVHLQEQFAGYYEGDQIFPAAQRVVYGTQVLKGHGPSLCFAG